MANEQNEPEKNDGNGSKQKNRKILIIVLICALAAVLAYGLLSRGDSASEEIPYSRFTQMVADDQVTEIELRGSKMTVTAKEDGGEKKTYTVTLVGDENSLKELLQGHPVKYSKKTPGIGEDLLSMLISVVLPMAVLIGVFLYLMRGRGGIFGVGKSRAKAYVQKETGVTFADVAGEDEAKESLQEVVEFLHSPEQFKKIGAVLPKGALLVGPPGTGKTLLAKAVAGEAGVPFFSLSGSEFVELFVGVGASRVRDLFDEAKRNAPCIIFIDEIDAIGKVRDSAGNGGNDEREQTLNQLLAEMDGFDSASGLLILAATNRPEILDPALLRPGRFDRRIIVDTPDLKGRVEILKVHAKDVLLDDTVDFNEVALATSGAVGSDLANMINEAAILAVRRGRAAVSQSDLMEAVEVVLVGKEKKNKILSEKERKIVSYHEVGHALVSALGKDSEPVQKITIIPRTMGALGYVMQMPEEEKYLNTKKELETMVVGLLAGRAAEEIVFDTVTTGASNDIERATSICRAMVTQYGMSERFGLIGLERTEDRYLTGRVVSECGDATATEVDHEVMEMLRKAYGRAKEILTANRDALDAIAGYLIQEETITGKEFMQLLHQVQDARTKEGGECAAEDDGSAAEGGECAAEGDACTVKGENAG
ncbi:MAG: ATP-dependent zinc metalloprotease FtsH [Lachnospiraceae bacterium]|jgi:cell division protease FtsH|nr:ATP-dependent zinc metalloprotease FtsH [Lachnospiraceae bacterium]